MTLYFPQSDALSGRRVLVVGGGPAGLIAAERLASAGIGTTVCDAMPSVGRKLLMAGRGGLNLTHAEPLDRFLARYGAAAERLGPMIERFPPGALRDWAASLGIETFVGSSSRVFPREMKASPLLRAWLARLAELNVRIRTRATWSGFDDAGRPIVDGEPVKVDATILALGGASWPRLGASGGWVETLSGLGVTVTALRPSNVGVRVNWSDHVRNRFAGSPLKTLAVLCGPLSVKGELVVTRAGLEGGAVYAIGPAIRDALDHGGHATIAIDLKPSETVEELSRKIAIAPSSLSLSNLLRRTLSLSPAVPSILRDVVASVPREPVALARLLKSVPIAVEGLSGMDRAISTAGGIAWASIDEALMLRALPGVFTAGEMLDWDAPTGGYLLQACFATGVAAAEGAIRWLDGPSNVKINEEATHA